MHLVNHSLTSIDFLSFSWLFFFVYQKLVIAWTVQLLLHWVPVVNWLMSKENGWRQKPPKKYFVDGLLFVAYVDWTEGMWQKHTALRHLMRGQWRQELLIDWKNCLKNYLLDLSNGCMQTYWYFIIILASVFAMLFVQSQQQRLSDSVPYQFAKRKISLPDRLISQTCSISSCLFSVGRHKMVKSASQQVLLNWTDHDLFTTWIYRFSCNNWLMFTLPFLEKKLMNRPFLLTPTNK